jgi:outer membrane protein assembly factor BamB
MKTKNHHGISGFALIAIALTCIITVSPAVAERWLAGQLIDLTKESGGDIPYGQTAITALTNGPGGNVYGGTSADKPGKECYLFRLKGDAIEILGKLSPAIPGQQKIWHSLVAASDGNIYGGTWTGAKPGEKQPSGHLFRYESKTASVVDLGMVSEGEGVYTMTSNDAKTILYGVTVPSCLLFSYDISKGKVRVLGDIMESIKTYLGAAKEEGTGKLIVTDVGEEKGKGWERSIGGSPWRKRYFPPRAIICDNAGNVWGSRDQGFFFKYDVKQDRLMDTAIEMPLMVGTEDAIITEISVDSLTKDSHGMIYGGTYSDGYLFRLNPATGEVICFGKPLRQQRIRALAMGQDGMVYGVGGEDSGISKLFRYNPKNGDMRELGVIHERGWTVYRIDTITIGPDGTVYLGESSRISHLIRIREFKYISVIGA